MCFTGDVLVKTNQGLIKIVDIAKENTIDGKKIIGISKIIYSQPNIVTIKKDALGENNPLADINVAPYHLFLINNKLEPIANFINEDTIFLRKTGACSINFDGYIDALAASCAHDTIAQWDGKLNGLETFMEDNCTTMVIYAMLD